VSGPVQSPAGYHIIKVLNRTKLSSNSNDEKSENETYISESESEEIRRILHRQKAEVQLQSWLKGIREKAYVEIKL
jgi:parvulin-like peptidyl-prolyl isomerase